MSFFLYTPGKLNLFTNHLQTSGDILVRTFRTEVPPGYQNKNQLLPPNVQFLSVYPHLTAWQSKAGFWIYLKQGGGFKYFFYCYPYLGMIPILTNIFQRGWNHQLAQEVSWVNASSNLLFIPTVDEFIIS